MLYAQLSMKMTKNHDIIMVNIYFIVLVFKIDTI